MKNIKYLYGLIVITTCFTVFSCENNVEEKYEIVNQKCDPKTSFANQIKPIIDKNCIECHNGNQFPDLRTYKGVSDNSVIIKQQVVSRSMPLGGSLTNEEIDLIACWIDNGSLNN